MKNETRVEIEGETSEIRQYIRRGVKKPRIVGVLMGVGNEARFGIGWCLIHRNDRQTKDYLEETLKIAKGRAFKNYVPGAPTKDIVPTSILPEWRGFVHRCDRYYNKNNRERAKNRK